VAHWSMLTRLILSGSVYCRPCGAENLKCCNFDQIFTFLGTLVPIPFTAGNSRPKVYAYTPNFLWIHLLCHLPGRKNCNFGQIFTFGGLLYLAPFSVRAKFGVLEHICGLHLHAKFCLDPHNSITPSSESIQILTAIASWNEVQIS